MSSGSSSSKRLVQDDQPIAPAEMHGTRPRSFKTPIIAGVLLLLTLLAIGLIPRIKRNHELTTSANAQETAAPVVQTLKPHRADPTNELVLPATTQAIQETLIYARTSGYVRRWYAGMGQNVHTGQLLAEIDVPETDQQLREARQQLSEADQTVMQTRAEFAEAQAGREQAEAALKQAQTSLQLARVNLERSKTLVAEGVLSQQDLDDKQAAFDARRADVEAAQATIRARQSAVKAQQSAIDAKLSSSSARQANVQRLADQQAFQKVVAPFDGTITARNIEVGTLINPNGSPANGAGIYKIARLDTMRIFINVPQNVAAAFHPGLPATVEARDLAQKTFSGSVFGTSHSIDPASRTMMVEIRIPNSDQQLLPGMYVQVKFALPASSSAVLIPATALVVNADGTQAIVLGANKTVHYRKVEVGQDFGKEVEITSGLETTDSVVANPSDGLREGMRVQVHK